MNLTVFEPGKVIRTIDADRERIRTFLVTDSGLPVEYDKPIRLDVTETDQ